MISLARHRAQKTGTPTHKSEMPPAGSAERLEPAVYAAGTGLDVALVTTGAGEGAFLVHLGSGFRVSET